MLDGSPGAKHLRIVGLSVAPMDPVGAFAPGPLKHAEWRQCLSRWMRVVMAKLQRLIPERIGVVHSIVLFGVPGLLL